ncbi:MAG: hypothetical protein ACP5RF_00315 [Candidatus Micrarchaeia archaeon]
MAKKNDITGAAELLYKDPSEKNWDKFASMLKKANIKYYRVIYQKGSLKNVEDLTKSYAELYDARENPVVRIPIFKKGAKGVEGATIYLKGLLNLNKVD